MQLEHSFSVDAPIETVWAALVEPERVAGCMPGATLTEVDGDKFTGQIKVKIGPVALVYKGVGNFIEKDEGAHRAVIEGSAKESRGQGTAKATVSMSLKDEGGTTTGSVVTDLAITGKPAQFGRGMLSDVGGKIIDQFSSCLSKKLGDAEPAAPASPATSATAAPDTSKPRVVEQPPEEAEALDLMAYAGGSVLKRVAPIVGAIVLGAIVFVVVRRLRG
ncbi:SRPBCC family protein [Gordonia sp. ABSL49_1]|uniref:SRPBCC family protein n=1 Tax=Gordonia sp. ABSL49_1 TaxID=2920941 RepID=UPI001F0F8447|nr:SRPBCC family protein [Gordonia sp. ABSL49_1]MCH5641208.1 SRPBCC family protein [Gordonia sp. ABSL49_1]